MRVRGHVCVCFGAPWGTAGRASLAGLASSTDSSREVQDTANISWVLVTVEHSLHKHCQAKDSVPEVPVPPLLRHGKET